MQLSAVNPITATEFALKKYAQKLEQENKRLKYDASCQIGVDIPTKEITVSGDLEKYWFTPIALTKVTAVPEGQEILIRGRESAGTKHFEIGYFIHEQDFRDKTAVSMVMAELHQQCLKHLMKIYD